MNKPGSVWSPIESDLKLFLSDSVRTMHGGLERNRTEPNPGRLRRGGGCVSHIHHKPLASHRELMTLNRARRGGTHEPTHRHSDYRWDTVWLGLADWAKCHDHTIINFQWLSVQMLNVGKRWKHKCSTQHKKPQLLSI